jgi:hypothetical protein
LHLALPPIRRPVAALLRTTRRIAHPPAPDPGLLRAGAESPPEPCFITVLYGGRPCRR